MLIVNPYALVPPYCEDESSMSNGSILSFFATPASSSRVTEPVAASIWLVGVLLGLHMAARCRFMWDTMLASTQWPVRSCDTRNRFSDWHRGHCTCAIKFPSSPISAVT